jgi:hypothetical protein
MITKGEQTITHLLSRTSPPGVVRTRRLVASSFPALRHHERMATIPTSTQTSLRQRLSSRAIRRWPALTEVHVRYRAGFAYVEGVLTDGQVLKLCRLRYAGYANQWGFAIYRASHDDYENSFLPTGSIGGTAEDALDTACGLYLNDPTAWT